MFRIWCLMIGYPFGSFLSAYFVSKKLSGKSPFEFGSGNPGMANVAHVLGIRAGVLVLTGDILKTLLACLLCYVLFSGSFMLTCLYTGLGCVVGHNFPFWHHFRGGKGVAVSCSAIILSMPLFGILSNLAGLAVVLVSGYLPLGAVVIPGIYAIILFILHKTEAAVLMCLYTIIMVQRHMSGLISIHDGTCRKVDPFAFLKHRK